MRNTKWLWMTLLVLPTSMAWSQSKISAINFRGSTDPSQVEITANGPIEYTIEEDVKDKQVILEVPNAQLAKGLNQKQDTSAFGTNVLSIEPIQVPVANTVRIVFQLKEMAKVEVDVKGNAIVASIPSQGGGYAGNPALAQDLLGAEDSTTTEQIEDLPPPGPMAPEASMAMNVQEPLDQKSQAIDDFLGALQEHKYVGGKITLQMKDADVADIFRLVSEASGFNIILGSDVRGTLTMALIDVPWDLALDTVFQTLRLGGKRQGNVLRVMTLLAITTEAQENQRAKQASEMNQQRITKLFPLSYADPGAITATLNAFLAAEQAEASAIPGAASAPVTATSATVPGALVQIDTRTNSVLVRDIPRRVDQMRKLILLMDTQTPQILIEAKVVEANENFSKSISGGIGGGNNLSGPFGASFNGADPFQAVAPAASDPTSGVTGAISWSPTVSFISGIKRLNAALQFGEAQGTSKSIASPRLVVLNKQAATITQGTPVLVPTTVVGPTGVPGQGVTMQSANLSMSVTPTVTNDGSVLMQLSLDRSVPITLSSGQTGVGTRNMNTQVLVESGSTLVIGGIYTQNSDESESGFPVLRKIPLIGALFGSQSSGSSRTELFFFITPRIINEKEAGLISKSDQG